MIVAAAHVGGDHHTFGTVFECQIVQPQARGLQQSGIDIRSEHFVEVVAAVSSPSAVVQLDVAATGGGQIANHGAIGGSEVLNQLFVVGIDGQCALGILAAEEFGVELCGSGNRLTRHNTFALKLFHELEVLDEGMIFAADLARETTRAASRFGFVELIAVFQLDVFHTLETPSEIEVPITATELTIGDHLQAGGQLALDEGGDALVFYLAEGGGVDFAGGKTGTGFVQTGGTQETADDVGAVGGR